jgi:hypothetical protein
VQDAEGTLALLRGQRHGDGALAAHPGEGAEATLAERGLDLLTELPLGLVSTHDRDRAEIAHEASLTGEGLAQGLGDLAARRVILKIEQDECGVRTRA